VDRISVSTQEVEAAYGKAAIASLRLHHVLTDFAIAMTAEDSAKILGSTSGGLRTLILRAADRVEYAEVRPYLQGWDHYLGQQSIRYRNHVVHAHLWNQNGRDLIGRIEGFHYTELTPELLLVLTARIHWSFLLLNQIFWDVLQPNYRDLGLIRSSPVHHFYARQSGLWGDLKEHLPFLQSEIPTSLRIAHRGAA
jgi:hypothetical protein